MTAAPPNNLNYFDERGVPDLQKLVSTFGTYSAIPQWAWTQCDADIAAYQERLRRGLRRQT
jgi:hypothetical protein